MYYKNWIFKSLLVFYIILPVFAISLKVNEKAIKFSARTGNRKLMKLEELHKNSPVFLYFISESCPINTKALDVYKLLYITFNKNLKTLKKSQNIPFYGIIDSSGKNYVEWKKIHEPPYEIFLDPEKKIIEAYGVERSPWVMKIGQSGKVEKIWKGYSVQALEELSNEIAKAIKIKPIKIDFSAAPKELRGG